MGLAEKYCYWQMQKNEVKKMNEFTYYYSGSCFRGSRDKSFLDLKDLPRYLAESSVSLKNIKPS